MKNHKLFINEIVGSPGTSKGLLFVSGRGSDRQRPWKSQLRRGAGGGKPPGDGLRVPLQAARGARWKSPWKITILLGALEHEWIRHPQ